MRFVTAVCTRPADAEGWVALPPLDPEAARALAQTAPPMLGGEYLDEGALLHLWEELNGAFAAAVEGHGANVQEALRALNPAWNLVGRVHFNLAETRGDPDTPFAFLATYTTGLSSAGRAQHRPLGQALREYADASEREPLLALLKPVQRAAEACPWLRVLVDSGALFHPLRWTPAEALRLLGDVAALEQAGVVVRMPAAWRSGRPPRPRVTATLGSTAPSMLGQAALLDFDVSVSLDGEALSEAEIQQLLTATSGLALLRGQWVEVDPGRLKRALGRFEAARRLAMESGIGFGAALRMLAGADIQEDAGDPGEAAEWAGATAGPWLKETLRALRAPGAETGPIPGLVGELRPYQRVGVRWLTLVTGLGLGACLADDMGLGKTIQVLSLLLTRLASRTGPSLLVAPASLLANWVAEAGRFAPSLRVLLAHGSAMSASRLKGLRADELGAYDLVLITYAALSRAPWATDTAWELVVLDEAQALKNPSAAQTRAAGRLKASARIALTGTPIENRLGDLWSIFDVINRGLLGSAPQFKRYTQRLPERTQNPYGPLRELIAPYILRRLKTDRSVIADLPEKTEVTAYCTLSRKQAALYQAAVAELAERIRETEGVQRRGLVLAFLSRFKQICDHPSLWLGDNAWGAEDSGKWSRIAEIAEVIAARQEKVLVFTQFASLIPALDEHLARLFGRPGLTLHGDTPVAERQRRVQRFQEDEDIPYFVLSLKAGGSGLNLTAASHVVHFDRWWNPAVENQATDRAFRIGQRKGVLVHKFVCRGTVEDNIDALIASKVQLASDLLEGGVDAKLTELDDAALLKLVALDLNAAME